MHLMVVDKGAVETLGKPRSRGQEQHVTMAQQGFGAHLVDDGPRVDLRRHLEGDSRRNVCLDEAGDDVHGGPLCGKNEVYA